MSLSWKSLASKYDNIFWVCVVDNKIFYFIETDVGDMTWAICVPNSSK